MRTTTAGAALMLVSVVLLAGCGTVAGAPTATTPASSTPTRNLYGAPHVERPLNVQKFLKAPCTVLTDAQVQRLHESAGIATESEPNLQGTFGPECDWEETFNASASSLSIGFMTKAKGYGLSSPYSHRRDFAIFQPMAPIGGYPVLRTASRTDDTLCSLAIGVSDDLLLDVSSDTGPSDDGSNQCVKARAGAKAMIQTIKSANGGG